MIVLKYRHTHTHARIKTQLTHTQGARQVCQADQVGGESDAAFSAAPYFLPVCVFLRGNS